MLITFSQLLNRASGDELEAGKTFEHIGFFRDGRLLITTDLMTGSPASSQATSEPVPSIPHGVV